MGGIAFRAPVLADALPDRRAREPRDARVVELRRRVPHPARRLQVEDRRSRSSPSPASRWPASTRCGSSSARCTTASGRDVELARDRAGRRARDRAARARSSSPSRSTRRSRSQARAQASVAASIATPSARRRRRRPGRRRGDPSPRAKGPHIDWAGLSPLIALLGGAIVVLLVGLLRPRAVREALVPLLAARRLRGRHRPRASGSSASAKDPRSRRAAPRRPDDRAHLRLLRAAGSAAIAAVVARASRRARRPTASSSRCC